MTDLLPVAFPLGSDPEIAMAIVNETHFAEFYTGLADPELEQCSYSHHFLPAGCIDFESLRNIARRAKALSRDLTINLNAAAYRDQWQPALDRYLEQIGEIGAKSVVVSNIGVMKYIKEKAPSLHIHVSSIGGAINSGAMEFYKKLGAHRIIYTRSMEADEVVRLSRSLEGVETEAFIMGGGCAFSEHSCNLPHFLFEEEERVRELGPSAIHKCPHRGGCQSPALLEYPNRDVQLKLLHPGFAGCGICYSLPFLDAGVDILKVTGRTQRGDLLLAQARQIDELLRTMLTNREPSALMEKCVKDKEDCLYGKVPLELKV